MTTETQNQEGLDEQSPFKVIERAPSDDKRDEIARIYREQRDEDERKAREDEGGDQFVQEPAAQEQVPEPSPQAQAPEDRDLELLVYGDRRVFKRSYLEQKYGLPGVPDDAIIRIAQKEMAADQRLDEARRAEASRAQSEPVNQRFDQATQGRESQADTGEPPQTSGDEDEFRELAERIQVGDADESSEAVRKIIEIAERRAQRAVRPDQVQAIVAQTLNQRTQFNETQNAVAEFGRDNPDLVENPYLQTVVLDVAAEEMRKELRRVGTPEATIKSLGNNRTAIADAYHAKRHEGNPLRDVGSILRDTGSEVRRVLKMQQPQQPQASQAPPPVDTQARIARKESAPQQPRHGGTRVDVTAPPRPRSPEDYIREQRRQRGYPS